MGDRATRTLGMVTITVKAEPVMGHPPPWANVIEIAEECIDKIVRPRYDTRNEDDDGHNDSKGIEVE